MVSRCHRLDKIRIKWEGEGPAPTTLAEASLQISFGPDGSALTHTNAIGWSMRLFTTFTRGIWSRLTISNLSDELGYT